MVFVEEYGILLMKKSKLNIGKIMINKIHKSNNISDVDIVKNGYFKKTIVMSFDLSYSIYKKDKKRFEKDIQNYVEKLGYECTCELADYNYNSYSRVEVKINCNDDRKDLTPLLSDLDFGINVIFLMNDYY